jgi:hypothetical protein
MSAPVIPFLSPPINSTIPTLPINSAVHLLPSEVNAVLSSDPSPPPPILSVPSVSITVPSPLKVIPVRFSPPPPPTIQTNSLPDPLPPDPLPLLSTNPKHPTLSANTLPDGSCERIWTSLFKRKPRNAGKYIPVDLTPVYEDDALVPPAEVIEAGAAVWNDTIVGFFLDKPLSYTAVVQKLKFIWKLKGAVSVKSDGTIFLFKFSCSEDRITILQSDPIVMNNKLFIIKPYDANVSNVTGSVTTVPVWVKLYNLPIFAWSPLGINWLCSHLGKLLCMDEMTEKQDRLSFAKCLIEIRPEKELADDFLVKLVEGGQQKIYVEYLWRPDVCVMCNRFGHKTVDCDNNDSSNTMCDKGNSKADREASKKENTEKVQAHKNIRPIKKQIGRTWQRIIRKKIVKEVTKENGEQIEEGSDETVPEKVNIDIHASVNAREKERKGKEIEKFSFESDELGNEERGEVEPVNIPGIINKTIEAPNNLKEVYSVEADLVDSLLISNKFDILNCLDVDDNIGTRDNESMTVVEKSGVSGAVNENTKGMNNIGSTEHVDQMVSNSIYTKQDKTDRITQSRDIIDNMQNDFTTVSGKMEIRLSNEGTSHEGLKSSEKKSKKCRKKFSSFSKTPNSNDETCMREVKCTTQQSHQTDIASVHVPAPSFIYSNIKPPSAYKKPPPLSPLTSPTTSPELPSELTTPSSTEGNTGRVDTPLSIEIPNYLSSSQAVTRRMKIELLKARAHQ